MFGRKLFEYDQMNSGQQLIGFITIYYVAKFGGFNSNPASFCGCVISLIKLVRP